MSVVEALILGAIQGLSEFLPISSKGHLVIGETVLGLRLTSLTFEILVHVATLGSVLLVLRSSLWRLVLERDVGYVAKVLLACVPAGLVGLVLKSEIERVFHAPVLTGVGLLFTGCVLLAVRFFPPGGLRAPTVAGALVVGLAQVLALLPGVSRSGMTIAAALAMGVAGTAAAEFSFLVSIPIITGAALLQSPEIVREAGGPAGAALAAGFGAAFVFGVAAIRLVYRLLARRRFSDFALYCLPAGALFLLYAWLRGA